MRPSVSRERAGRAFRLRPEILFHAALLAAATAVVALGSRTQSAHGILPPDEGVPAAVASRESPAARAAAQRQIATAEKTWAEAHRRADAALLRRLLAAEFTFTDPAGRVSDTRDYLASVASVGAASEATPGPAAATPDEIETRGTRTLLYGGTAVVSGETVARGRRGGKAFQESVRFLRVYVHRDGRWQMVAGQDTPIPSTSSLVSPNPTRPG
jgi:ketosteroid isomerase-like protein